MSETKTIKTFRVKADFAFEAENIDDAFIKLSELFQNMGKDIDYTSIVNGSVEIAPVGTKKEG